MGGVCDVPVVSEVCDSAGDAAASLVTAPFDWLAQAMGGAAAWMFESVWTVFDSTTHVDVSSGEYTRVYNILFGVAVFIMLGFFMLQVIGGMVRREPAALSRAALGLAKSILGSFVALSLLATALEVTDQLCVGIVQAAGTNMEEMGERITLLAAGLAGINVAAPGTGGSRWLCGVTRRHGRKDRGAGSVGWRIVAVAGSRVGEMLDCIFPAGVVVMADRDAFDEAYGRGVPRAVRRPPRSAAPRLRDVPLDAGAALPGPPVGATAVSVEPTAFGGSVLKSDGSIARGWVVVEGGQIVSVRSTKPRDVELAISTGGVILPGLIDLHGHPEYNVFAAWEPPKVYINRGRWRESDEYDQLIKQPWGALTSGGKSVSVKTAMTRYAEVRAAVGGVTAIQGASKDYPNKAEALVRNVDLLIFGDQVARSTVDFDRLDKDDVESIRKGIFETRMVKAHYVHLAEGQKTNQTSVNEFLRFTASPLFSAATVMIHGTALARVHFDQLAAVGGKLVWSPQSNLRLYNETTDIGAALAAGVPVALGADWMPSGSPSLLHEMKVAWQVLSQTPGTPVKAPDLVRMVTSDAAEIAGFADKIGTLEVGRAADLTILQKRLDDPYENVVSAYPSWVELVVIGGDIIYGRADWVAELSTPADYEQVTAWGRPMLLDTRFGSPDDGGVDGPPRRLAEMRAKLIARYPAVGPIFA